MNKKNWRKNSCNLRHTESTKGSSLYWNKRNAWMSEKEMKILKYIYSIRTTAEDKSMSLVSSEYVLFLFVSQSFFFLVLSIGSSADKIQCLQ